jgi:hypothetical protein
MKPDKRVQFPQAAAPVDETLARAVISLADALARGDATKFGGMLGGDAKPLLDQLTSDGAWDESTAKIEAVRIVMIDDQAPPPPPSATMTSAHIYVAVQQPGAAYVIGFNATRDDAGWKFAGTRSTSQTKPRASDFDSMSAMALARDAGPATGSRETSNDPTAPNTVIETPAGEPTKPPAEGPRKVNTPAGPVTIPGSG